MVGKRGVLELRFNISEVDVFLYLAGMSVNENSLFIFCDCLSHLRQQLEIEPNMDVFCSRDDIAAEKVILTTAGECNNLIEQMPGNPVVSAVRVAVADKNCFFHKKKQCRQILTAP